VLYPQIYSTDLNDLRLLASFGEAWYHSHTGLTLTSTSLFRIIVFWDPKGYGIPLSVVTRCYTSPVRRFAKGLREAAAAVQAAVTLPWSQGPIEGHSNRLKMLKRQMFGRARLDLLARRFLLAA
jgi:hypothetical protein